MLSPKKKLEDIQKYYRETQDSGFTCIIYGEAGCGKTHLLTTAKRPLLVFCLDPRGATTIEQVAPEAIASGDIILDRRWEEAGKDTYVKFHQELTELYKAGVFSEVKTVAVDSFSGLNDSLLAWLKSKRKADDVHGTPPDGAGYGQLQIQDWGKFAESCTKTISKLMALPCDVIITAHVEHDKDDTTGEFISSLSVEGKKMKTRLPNLISEVYRLEQAGQPDKPRKLWTTRNNRYRAKSRLGLPNIIENPDLGEIQDKARDFANKARANKQQGG